MSLIIDCADRKDMETRRKLLPTSPSLIAYDLREVDIIL